LQNQTKDLKEWKKKKKKKRGGDEGAFATDHTCAISKMPSFSAVE
jgi:hypothetical protein